MESAEADPFQSTWTGLAYLGDRAGARDVERMVDEPFHLLHEPQGIPELCVRVERRLVEPLRVNEKQPRIARGGISSDLQTTGLVARLGHLRAQCGGDRLLVSFACVKAGNNYKLYGMLRHILGQYTWIVACARTRARDGRK